MGCYKERAWHAHIVHWMFALLVSTLCVNGLRDPESDVLKKKFLFQLQNSRELL